MITVGGKAGLTFIAAKPVTAAGTGEQRKASLLSSAWTPTMRSLSMIGLVSRLAHGWRRKNHGKTRFAGGRMTLTLNARALVIAVVTGVERLEAIEWQRASHHETENKKKKAFAGRVLYE